VKRIHSRRLFARLVENLAEAVVYDDFFAGLHGEGKDTHLVWVGHFDTEGRSRDSATSNLPEKHSQIVVLGVPESFLRYHAKTTISMNGPDESFAGSDCVSRPAHCRLKLMKRNIHVKRKFSLAAFGLFESKKSP
jgi:hypothetical protein